ncbi:TraR/DksA C4-type zinc finger protein [Pseudoalteromonas sp. S1688]|uniref:TraR/DksA C4-type zinc finger protein n=1 Tax=Pseudoalteromonas sp. S1688 TaxID=579511 RepID=UPI00110A8047|nr:TraR/DksA C4-type zinc finger protein [Pseudoalteromonas sp. S1688]TMP50268.1 conjugal transfer protein TraR [Pseudoalteromonas sp. S1688]
MDAADNAQIEIDREQARQIANLKQAEVVATDECIECGNEIPEERRKAVNTNLCIGCAEMQEIKRKQFRR